MHEIAKILLLKASTSIVATGIPTNVNRNVTFIVDTKHLENVEDLKCDELGSWSCTGVKTDIFKKKNTKVKKVSKTDTKKSDRYKFTRRYYVNDSLKSLKKTITTAEDCKDNLPYRFVFVQYMFLQGEQTVTVMPHGNSKDNKPYKRTMKSTLGQIKADVEKCVDPRKVIHNIINNKGGIEKIQSGGELPRNRKQIYNAVQVATKNDKIPDPLEYLMKKSKLELQDENSAFIRSVQTTPEPMIFLATKQQLIDIERFCTNPENFCVLGVDATFELCDYYLTFATYRNQMLETKNGKHPTLVGPAILHKKKLERSYHVLPSEMTRWHPPCAGVLAVGTDGELNLANSLLNVFRSAEHLRCDLHMKDNLKSKLSSLGIPHAISKEYMDDIFGRGNEAGLVHCLSAEDFDVAFEQLKQKWETRHSKGKEFTTYFLNKKAGDIKSTMTVEIRSMCGLGYPPEVYTQNASESMNKILKDEDKDDPTTRRTKKTVCDIVDRVRKVVERQQNEQFLAVIGRGEYQLGKNFKFLEVGDKYFQMNDKQKQQMRKKFFNCSLSKETATKSSGTNDFTTHTKSLSNQLSVAPEKSEIISVPFTILKEMFADASIFIKSSSSIVKAPDMCTSTINGSSEELWFVASKVGLKKPHSINVAATGKVECDSSCVDWARHRICSHTLAVSEKRGYLRQYLQWFRKNRKTGSITNMADVGMPKSSGQKKKATQKRKGRANIATPVVQTSLPDQNRWSSVPCNPIISTASNNSTIYQAPLPAQTCAEQGSAVYNPPIFYPSPIQTPQVPVFPRFDAYSTITTKPNPHPGCFEVTLLHLCDSRVSTCHGCGQPIRTPGMPLPPPADLVVVTKMRRDYTTTVGEKRQGKLGNVYFHANLSCIRTKHASFMLNVLYVQPHVRQLLTPLHKQYLLTSIGFSV